MKSLQFKRLVLVSDTIKSANQFEFQKRFNLITGKNNSIGKSTLVQNLFWALGCEPDFDDNWKGLNVKALLEFSIAEQIYTVVRLNKKQILFGNKQDGFSVFHKVTGEYSELIANLVQFKAKLPKRINNSEIDNPELETPPPAYYFLPFYIDQLRSWSSPWNSFKDLGQYLRWQKTIIDYHTGYLTPEHFEIEETIFELKVQQKNADEDIIRIDTALSVVEEYIPLNTLILSEEEFQETILSIEKELNELAIMQEELLNNLTINRISHQHLLNQRILALKAADEIEKDYQFAVECIEDDSLTCPLCGTLHDNSLISRAGILADKEQAYEQARLLKYELVKLSTVIDREQLSLYEVRKKISLIHNKYKRYSTSNNENPTSWLDGFASHSVQKNVEETKNQKQSYSKNLADKQKNLKKEQGSLLKKREKDDLNSKFIGFLTEFIHKLKAEGVSFNNIKRPKDYNKIFGSGGAADSTRAVLAYQLAIFRQIYFVGNEIPAPFVIDTPNQHEQADHHYDKIVKLILEDTPENSQIILCGGKSKACTVCWKSKNYRIE